MKTYKLVNNLTGWFIFAIAAFTYCSTIEPTASFWDCPEFISTAYKMEIGHPPGAPFFMLVGKFFSLFASDASEVAMMINIMSALLSAGCILLLFWSITHLARKLLCRDDAEEISMGKIIAIMASGVGGALIYTWSDTFWFSAVEGEVYAFSSFFTALVFWLILKWEDHADDPHSDRWLVLIAYLMGLSIGVHLLNLLCIPAIVLVFYYKKWKEPTFAGSLAALGISVIVIIAVLYGIVPGIVKVGGWFELMFVNELGLPFNSGFFVYLLLLIASLVYALYLTEKSQNRTLIFIMFMVCTALLGIPFYGHGVGSVIIGLLALIGLGVLLYVYREKVTKRLLNTTLLCMTLMTVGYASYAVIVIRSTANPPMDQDAPEDPFKLGEYLGREQYGDRPLFWGPTYASIPVIEVDEMGNPHYATTEQSVSWRPVAKKTADEPDRYMIANTKTDYVYPADQSQFFPRIYSSSHASRYKDWLMDPSTTMVENRSEYGPRYVEIPTWWENMKYFFGYQVGFMYFRYFMWNFAGRQNDIQALSYGNEHGNWITGISFIDNALYGDQENLPDELKNNKGRNVFYCLPLLLGLIGLFWQAYSGQRGIQQFWVVFFLFFMTGLAIVVYLNQTPGQPRERDYAYAGSFYAFAIWCGLGVTAIYDQAHKFAKSNQTIIKFLYYLGIVLAVAAGAWLLAKGCEAMDIPFMPFLDDFFYAIAGVAAIVFIISLLFFIVSYIVSRIVKMPIKAPSVVAAIACGVVAVAVPLQMVSQTWDDHDRSDRYMCRDFGLNYLQTVPRNGIIFTCGDNDTFPLWYNEDTEGKRTDVRVCNLSYLQTDWYIDQMRRPAYESDPLPISWQPYEYATVDGSDPNYRETIEVNPVLDYHRGSDGKPLRDANGNPMEITVADYVEIFYSRYPEYAKQVWGDDPFELNNVIDKFVLGHNQDVIDKLPDDLRSMVEVVPKNCIPSDFVHIKVNQDAVRKSGMKLFGDSIPEYMEIDLRYRVGQQLLPRRQNPDRNKSVITKSYMMMLEMIAKNNFERPFYMSTTVGYDNYAELCQHFVLEGMAWRITPYTFSSDEGYDVMSSPAVDTDKMFENMVKKYHYGNLTQEDLYIDETSMRMCNTHRRWFSILIRELVKEGKLDKAREALKFCEREIPDYNVPYNVTYGGSDIAQAWAKCRNARRANAILQTMAKGCEQYLEYYFSLNNRHFSFASSGMLMNWQELAEIMRAYKELAVDETIDPKQQKIYEDEFNKLYQYYMKNGEVYIRRMADLGQPMESTLKSFTNMYEQVRDGWYFMSYEERYQLYLEQQMKAMEAVSDTTSPDSSELL